MSKVNLKYEVKAIVRIKKMHVKYNYLWNVVTANFMKHVIWNFKCNTPDCSYIIDGYLFWELEWQLK